ncbi:MAG: hypothetical protein V3G41_06585 [Lachnospiraceae bacterium]
MEIGRLNGPGYGYNMPWMYQAGASLGIGTGDAGRAGRISGSDETEKAGEVSGENDVQKGIDDPVAKSTGKKECQTCKERKYVDGSDEQVSFKSAARINPNAVYARVRAHEQEHVTNAYDKAMENGGRVKQASVSIHYAICPECGRRYVSGGTTHTSISYPKDNAYGSNKKAFEAEATRGNNIDMAV